MWKFEPILKPTIWGGNRMLKYKGLDKVLSNIGESWEVSGITGAESVVSDGPDKGLTLSQLVNKYGDELLGKRNYKKYGDEFPLLVKIIDTSADLSVQVHPDDETAEKHGLKCGKTEMWYVVRAEKGARIANGFKREVNAEEYERLVASGEIESVLDYMDAKPGNIFFIPGGRVHAICSGCLIVEVQQSSDTTYRIYDYHRKDKDGKERQLHTAQAREAINFSDTHGQPIEYTSLTNIPVNAIKSPFFSVNILDADTEIMRDYTESDTFVILTMTDGEAEITCGQRTTLLKEGNSVLVPAKALGIIINPKRKARLIESYIK